MKTCQALLAVCAYAILPLHGADLSDLTYTTTDGKVTITDCDEAASGELVIPDTIEGNPVTRIGNNAFRVCTNLTNITFGENSKLTSIGDYAFFECANLTSITIPDGVTSIGVWAFRDCANLKTVTFLGDAPTLGSNVFSGVNTNVIEIRIRENATGFDQEFAGLKVAILAFLRFEIREILYNKTQNTFTLTWKSNRDKMYALYFSETLEEFDADVNDSIPSGGNSTTYGPFNNPIPDSRKLFFKAEEIEE